MAQSSEQDINELCNKLETALAQCKGTDNLIIQGDLNTKVGMTRESNNIEQWVLGEMYPGEDVCSDHVPTISVVY